MNKYRRQLIVNASALVSEIKSEIDALAATEQTQIPTDLEKLATDEENWTSRVEDLRVDLCDVREEEQDCYDSLPDASRSTQQGQTSLRAISSLLSVDQHLAELMNCQEVGQFVKLYHEKYDDIISRLEAARA